MAESVARRWPAWTSTRSARPEGLRAVTRSALAARPSPRSGPARPPRPSPATARVARRRSARTRPRRGRAGRGPAPACPPRCGRRRRRGSRPPPAPSPAPAPRPRWPRRPRAPRGSRGEHLGEHAGGDVPAPVRRLGLHLARERVAPRRHRLRLERLGREAGRHLAADHPRHVVLEPQLADLLGVGADPHADQLLARRAAGGEQGERGGDDAARAHASSAARAAARDPARRASFTLCQTNQATASTPATTMTSSKRW